MLVSGTHTKIDDTLGHGGGGGPLTNLKESKLYTVFSEHNGIKLEVSNRKITEKSLNTWELKHF